MSKTTIREYVEHICSKHQRSGTVKTTLVELQDKLTKEVGPCKPDSPDGKPGVPLDSSKIETWGELLYLRGFLQTPAAWLIDCNCKGHQSSKR